MTYGKLYGVGVGPGDPKQMTYLAVETIRKCPVLAIPAGGGDYSVSYRIASGMVEDLDDKEHLDIPTPMTKDRDVLDASYREAAERIADQLAMGRDVAYLTLGDPTIYATYIYIHRLIKDMGYEAVIVNGIPSFCAVAAKLGDSLCDRSEQLHIIPSSYDIEDALALPGTKVLMKAGSNLQNVKGFLMQSGDSCEAVANCGLEGEEVYRSADSLPEKGSYFTVVVVKENRS